MNSFPVQQSFPPSQVGVQQQAQSVVNNLGGNNSWRYGGAGQQGVQIQSVQISSQQTIQKSLSTIGHTQQLQVNSLQATQNQFVQGQRSSQQVKLQFGSSGQIGGPTMIGSSGNIQGQFVQPPIGAQPQIQFQNRQPMIPNTNYSGFGR